MNKLGFAIKLASEGASNAIECNKGQWTNKVVDIREYLKLFNGLQGTDNTVTFMSFDEGGCFLTQLRAISGRGGDFLSGWIYIPNTIEASGEEIMTTYYYVRNILSQSNLSDLKEDIDSFFSKEYPLKEVAAQYVASRGQLYGFRFLGHFTLKEIVGKHRYQPYYSEYKAVFLLNKDEEVSISKEAESCFRNLTEKDIVKTSILVPPPNTSLQSLGGGTKIHTSDGSDFNQPMLVNVGSKVTLLLSRVGFENMKLEISVTSEKRVVDFSNVKITWKKKISALMFTIMNDKQEKIDKKEVHIYVNGNDISSQEILVTEEECRQARIKVTAPDYEVYEEQNQSLLQDDLVITLHREIKPHQIDVELANGKHAKMTVESDGSLSCDKNPLLKGYKLDKESNHGEVIFKLTPSPWFLWKQRLWGVLAIIALIILICVSMAFNAWINTHHFKFGLPPWKEDRPAQTWQQNTNNGTEEAETTETNEQQVNQQMQIRDYLNQNDQWAKDTLDQYSLTKDLYDMINNYRFADILNNIRIDNCDKINEIKKISKSMSDKGVFTLSGPYSQDGTITIQKWIETVNTKYYQQGNTENNESDNNKPVKETKKEVAKKKATEEEAKKNGGL